MSEVLRHSQYTSHILPITRELFSKFLLCPEIPEILYSKDNTRN